MKKIAAFALAGLMGVSALAVTAGSAAANPPWNHNNNNWNHGNWNHGNWNHGHWNRGPGWGWGGPFLLGLGVGTLYSNSYDYGYGGGWNDHVRWCEANYRTYNPRTDTFYIRAGVPARCVAPFDRY